MNPRLRAAALEVAALAALVDAARVARVAGLPRGASARVAALAGAAGGAALFVTAVALALALARGAYLRAPARVRPWGRVLCATLLGLAFAAAAFRGAALARAGLTAPLFVASALGSVVAVELLARPRGRALGAWALTSRLGRAGLALGAAALWLAHATLLPRLYPALHLVAALAAALAALLSRLHRRAPEPTRGARRAHALLALLALLAVVAATRFESSLGHALRAAPLGTYPLSLAARALRPRRPPALPASDDERATGPSLPLAGLDVLLVSVDALRADRLGAYGSRAGLTPTLDALAAEGVVVERAYCSTPHTSYSLASLMTGKYFREVSALGEPPRPHETLAGLFGAAGYRTAGFYPPAVFFVDGARLGALRSEGFGFAHRAEGYADAARRADEVDAYLATVPATQRVLLWVHLFEPHEPYDPQGRVPRDAPARARYDAEVAAVDAGVHRLREVLARHGRRAALVLTADHGEEFGEHGGRFHGTTLYDEQARVPLLFVVPGVAPRRARGPASAVDVLPTLLAGAGLARPRRVRGRDLGPWLLGARADAPFVFASVGATQLVTDGDDKLLCDVREDVCELYALASDPLERANLIDTAGPRALRLRAELARWSGSHGGFERRAAGVAAPPRPAALERALQGDRGAVDELQRALPGLAAKTQLEAARALLALGVDTPALRDVLLSLLLRASDPAASRGAGLALAGLGDARGARAALEALHAEAPGEALEAACALARLGRDEGAALLERVALDGAAGDDARDRALAALLERLPARPGPVRALLARLLEDPRLSPRAAELLGAHGGPDDAPALARALRATPYALTRQRALEALLRLAPADAAAHLEAALCADEPPAALDAALAALPPALASAQRFEAPPSARARRSATPRLRGAPLRAGERCLALELEPAPPARGALDAPFALRINGVATAFEPGQRWVYARVAQRRWPPELRGSAPFVLRRALAVTVPAPAPAEPTAAAP